AWFPGDDFLGVAAAEAVEPRIETYRRERPVAPGVTLASFDRYGPDGWSGTPTWLRGDSLTVDLTRGTVADYLFPGRVAAAAPLSTLAADAGAVAAVNGDFFDINNSSAPLGVGVRGGELIQSPHADPAARRSAVTFPEDAGGLGAIGEVFFEGTVTLPAGTVPLAGVNKPGLPAGGIGAYGPAWGTYCRCVATAGAAAVTEVEVLGGVVTAVRDRAGEGPVPPGGVVLVGREAGAATLAALAVGDPVAVAHSVRSEQGQRIRAAIGGRQLLVVNGVPQRAGAGDNAPTAPRTAVGFSRDGGRMFVLSLDGRQPAFADGVGLDELATMMAGLGAWSAVNLDGGGSTTIVARTPGAATPGLENSPSDGAERPVPNGLGLFTPAGSGRPHGYWVETAVRPERASGATAVAPGRPERVFPGLTRRLTAAAYDETYGPAAGTPRWRTSSAAHGVVDRDGVFRGVRPGPVTAIAADGRGVRGELALTVLNPLARLDFTADRLALGGAGQSATVGVVGYDRDGASAPVEPADVRLEHDGALLDVAPGADGRFTVTARGGSGATLVTAVVNGVRTVLPVTVGLDEVPLADFEDPAGWSYSGERAPGSVGPAPGNDGAGLRLSYDFTTSTQTRTGGALAPSGLVVPGQPRAFRLWVRSAGRGEWPSLQAWDGAGQLLAAMRAPHLTTPGWQRLEFTVPSGTRYPLTLRRFYAAETRADASYRGELVIDGLTALVPPSLDVPPEPVVADPVVVPDVGGAPWRFAVMSDAQFVARDPDSELVRAARRTLREIRAARPDLVLVNGDLVDEASPADLALARRVLDEELRGEVPYVYVPGNHERSGGSLANFRAEFGETRRVFDHHGVRFVTVDTSALSLRASDWTQLRDLRAELDRAATDPAVRSVVVVQHVPPRDPTPARASELADRKEAATVESWLADFRATSGKPVAFIGAHVGSFSAGRVDGVPYFVNGNSGKNPSTGPAAGGFTGWSLWGSDLTVQTRPHVDALAVTAPDSLAPGDTALVSAAIGQAGRTVPVAHPVSASWTASPSVHLGPAHGLRPWHAAWFDPATGRLRALRPATVTLAVTVNGTTAVTTVRVVAVAAAVLVAA
ncbi:MAG TPA: phosphodiester glycosidase family protein, partial [Pseudonocardiaceae bacterium]